MSHPEGTLAPSGPARNSAGLAGLIPPSFALERRAPGKKPQSPPLRPSLPKSGSPSSADESIGLETHLKTSAKRSLSCVRRHAPSTDSPDSHTRLTTAHLRLP